MKILILEDSRDDAELMRRMLNRSMKGLEFFLAENKAAFLQGLREFAPDIILADNSLPQFDANEALQIVRLEYGNLPFILVTGTASEEFAAGIIKAGADDYILKDRMTRLPGAIESAIRQRKTEAEKETARGNLVHSEMKYREMVERISEGFISFNHNLEIQYINELGEKMFNRPHNYLIGKTICDEFPATKGQALNLAFEKAMKTGQAMVLEEYSYAMEKWVEVHIYPSSTGLSVYFRDISGKKEADDRLRHFNERLGTLAKAANEAIWDWNLSSGEVWCSDAFYKYLGLDPNLRGVSLQHLLNTFSPEALDSVKESINELLNGEKTECFREETYRRPDGTMGTLDLRCFALTGENKKVNRLIGSFTDISERKKLERELEDQLRLEQIHITATALEASEKERTTIGRELHDNVNQILASTRMLLNLVIDDPVSHKALLQNCITNIQDAITENRKIAHHLVTPDMIQETMIVQLNKLFDSMFGPAGIAVQLDASGFREERLESAQKLTVYRIVQEQCTNILKYAGASEVVCRLQTMRNKFSLLMSDNGKGSESLKVSHGIGLKNMAGRVSIYGGDLRVSSRPGKGFSIEVSFPIPENAEKVPS